MPTGYTAAIADDISFEQYALGCARAFGALVTMRDEPSDAPIPEKFEPSTYYQRMLEESHATLEKISTWTPEQVAIEYRADFDNRMKAHQDRLQRSAVLRAKYDAMLDQVRAWKAPTSDHIEYKSFMEKQITESIEFDCCTKYDEPPQIEDPMQWRDNWVEDLHERIDRYEQQHRAEVERAHSRTQWVKALRDSLPRTA